jgi:hypothetical protein
VFVDMPNVSHSVAIAKRKNVWKDRCIA